MTDERSSASQSSPATIASLDPRLLEILVCPVTKLALQFDSARQELISRQARLAFPIRHGVPIMLIDEARQIDAF